MCNSVTGTVEASSGRASQRKPGQGLIAVTLRGFFFVHSLSELRQLSASFQSALPQSLWVLSDFMFPSPGGTVQWPLLPVGSELPPPPTRQCSLNMCFQSRVESMLAKTPQHWRATALDATGRRGMKYWGRLRLRLFYRLTCSRVYLQRNWGTAGAPHKRQMTTTIV